MSSATTTFACMSSCTDSGFSSCGGLATPPARPRGHFRRIWILHSLHAVHLPLPRGLGRPACRRSRGKMTTCLSSDLDDYVARIGPEVSTVTQSGYVPPPSRGTSRSSAGAPGRTLRRTRRGRAPAARSASSPIRPPRSPRRSHSAAVRTRACTRRRSPRFPGDDERLLTRPRVDHPVRQAARAAVPSRTATCGAWGRGRPDPAGRDRGAPRSRPACRLGSSRGTEIGPGGQGLLPHPHLDAALHGAERRAGCARIGLEATS